MSTLHWVGFCCCLCVCVFFSFFSFFFLFFFFFFFFGYISPTTMHSPCKDREGKPKSFGFVCFKHPESVSYAIALLNGIRLYGRPINVQYRFGRSCHRWIFQVCFVDGVVLRGVNIVCSIWCIGPLWSLLNFLKIHVDIENVIWLISIANSIALFSIWKFKMFYLSTSQKVATILLFAVLN